MYHMDAKYARFVCFADVVAIAYTNCFGFWTSTLVTSDLYASGILSPFVHQPIRLLGRLPAAMQAPAPV